MVITPTRERLFTLTTPEEVAALAQEEIEALEARIEQLQSQLKTAKRDAILEAGRKFPSMLRRMWSGTDVIYWLAEHADSIGSQHDSVCAHNWVSADNKLVGGLSICTNCKELRATDTIGKE